MKYLADDGVHLKDSQQIYEQVFTEHQECSTPCLPFDETDNNTKINEYNFDNKYCNYDQSSQDYHNILFIKFCICNKLNLVNYGFFIHGSLVIAPFSNDCEL